VQDFGGKHPQGRFAPLAASRTFSTSVSGVQPAI
jgi:hypothetical protein